MNFRGMTREQYEAYLDKQIDCLLRDDMEGFQQAAGYEFTPRTHSSAWSTAGGVGQGGLFSILPHSRQGHCASSIEGAASLDGLDGKLKDFLLAGSPIRLYDQTGTRKFTAEQLQEFKRRQVSARYDYQPAAETV